MAFVISGGAGAGAGHPVTATSTSADGFSSLGISLAGIHNFISYVAKKGCNCNGMTTKEVCEAYLKPFTLATLGPYCEQMASQDSPNLAPATVFVSHAWDGRFMDVANALETWQSRQSVPHFFWFDIFTNGQHGTENKPFDWWKGCFAHNVGRIGHTLLVLQWLNPLPLTRAWCIWEIVCTLATKSKLDVIMSAAEEKSYAAAMVDQFETLMTTLCAVDVKKSQCHKPEDREAIFTAIHSTIGFAETNKLVIGSMREWMSQTAAALMPCIQDPLQLSTFQLSTAKLLQAHGKLSEAEPMFRAALEGRRRVLGDAHPDTLVSLNNLANLLRAQGKLSEAEPLFRAVLEGRHHVLGDAHPRTLTSINNLASLLQDQGKLSEAESLYRAALEGHRQVLGDAHPGTLTFMNNLASLLQDQGKLSEAEPLYRAALEGHRAARGNDHPDTLTNINNLAALLIAQGKLSEAEPLFRNALQGLQLVLGDDHPDTLVSINNLASLLKAQGKLCEAEQMFRAVLEGRRRVLEDAHPDTLTSINNLAELLMDQGKLGEAEPMFQAALAGRRLVLGDAHPDTAKTAKWMQAVLEQQGKQ